jgi:hypothetical protein
MTTTVRRLKINRRYESSACCWCGDALTLGQDGAVCEACESPHHVRCWDNENGCGETGCVNAPLRQDPTLFVPDEQFFPNQPRCSDCGQILTVGTTVCPDCQWFETPSHFTEGVRETADEALQAFLLAIVSVFVPPILSFLFYDYYQSRIWSLLPLALGVQSGRNAFKKAGVAKNQIASDQTLKGTGLAITAQIFGVVGIALTVLVTLTIFVKGK